MELARGEKRDSGAEKGEFGRDKEKIERKMSGSAGERTGAKRAIARQQVDSREYYLNT